MLILINALPISMKLMAVVFALPSAPGAGPERRPDWQRKYGGVNYVYEISASKPGRTIWVA